MAESDDETGLVDVKVRFMILIKVILAVYYSWKFSKSGEDFFFPNYFRFHIFVSAHCRLDWL